MNKIYNTQENVALYRARPELSQSDIKKGINDYRLYNSLEEKTMTQSMIIGDIVDMLLTSENPSKDINDKYFIVTNTLTEKETDIVDRLINYLPEGSLYLEDNRDIVLNVANEVEYQTRWKDDTRINKIIEKCGEYFDLLQSNQGKMGISDEYLLTATEIYEGINRAFRDFLHKEGYTSENTTIYFQKDLYSTFCNTPVKGLFDALIVHYNEENKDVVLQAIDFKTSIQEPLLKTFMESFNRFRYDIQGAFYNRLLLHNADIFMKDYPEALSVSVNNFKFLFGNTQGAFVAELDLALEMKAIEGDFPRTNSKGFIGYKKGIKELIDDYNYYKENPEIEREISQRKVSNQYLHIKDYNHIE